MYLEYILIILLLTFLIYRKKIFRHILFRDKIYSPLNYRKTCPKSEYLEIDQDILDLSQNVLSSSEIAEANKISEDLTIKYKCGNAIRILQSKIGMRPKRPIYYANFHLTHLPHWTRDAVTDLGDYIDQLIKYCVSEKKKGLFRPRSLGPNLEALKGIVSKDLREKLSQYNKIIYVPAKHDFNVANRRHRFTPKEVVYITFLTKKLDQEIINISDRARAYSEDKLY